MKKELHEVLDALTPEEADTLPEEVFQAETLDTVTLRRIEHAIEEKTGLSLNVSSPAASSTAAAGKTKQKRKTVSGKLWRAAAAAACILLFAGAGITTCSLASDKKEYKDALAFFHEHSLSSENLTKNEIREVYRDFYTNSFSSDLTTQVLLNSRQDLLSGYEITGDATEHDASRPGTSAEYYKTPIYYEYNSVYAPADGQSSGEFQESRFAKYKNGETLWEISFDEFSIDGYYGDTESDGSPVLVYGTEPHADENGRSARIVVLDADGTVLWEAVQNTDNARYRIFEVLSDTEGSYLVFSRSGDSRLCINKYTKDGAAVFAAEHEVGHHTIESVTPSETGYLVHLSSYLTSEYSRIIKLDLEGNLVNDIRYDSGECDFYISDLCEYNGTIYISGYSTPKAPADYTNFRDRNILTLMETVLDAGVLSAKELTALFREQFTAVLLICEADSGSPKEFYSVPGSLGDEVYLNSGSVCWFTRDIISGEYSAEPFEMDGEVWGSTNPRYTAVCRFYANIFNKDGSFQEQKKLDLMTVLHWGY